jgi:hypothetical protein
MAGELYDLWHAHLSPLSTSFQWKESFIYHIQLLTKREIPKIEKGTKGEELSRLVLANDGPALGVKGERVDAKVERSAGVVMVEENQLVVVVPEDRLASGSDDLEKAGKGREEDVSVCCKRREPEESEMMTSGERGTNGSLRSKDLGSSSLESGHAVLVGVRAKDVVRSVHPDIVSRVEAGAALVVGREEPVVAVLLDDCT